MSVDAINGNFYMPPVDKLQGVSQGGSSRRTQGISGHQTAGYNPFAELAGINGELMPNYVDPAFAPTSFVNGINEHGSFTFSVIG